MSDIVEYYVGQGDWGHDIDVEMAVDLTSATHIRAVLSLTDQVGVVKIDLTVPGSATTVAQVPFAQLAALPTVGTYEMTVAAKSGTYEVSSKLIKVHVGRRCVSSGFWD